MNHRKYSAIKIESINGCGPQFRKFLSSVSDRIISISFQNCTFETKELLFVWSMVTPNLEFLAFKSTPTQEQVGLPKIVMP